MAVNYQIGLRDGYHLTTRELQDETDETIDGSRPTNATPGSTGTAGL